MEEENIFDKIKETFGSLPDNFNVLQEEIDIELQMEYFKASEKLRQSESGSIKNNINILFSKDSLLIEKKNSLIKLASFEDVEAFRAIEKYCNESDSELHQWAVLALQESRMMLESELLGENQVFISTGLGGKGNSLRYFVVLINKKSKAFTDVQLKIIKNEFEFTLAKYESEIESIEKDANYVSLLVIMPLSAPIKDVFQEAIKESNQFGDFISENLIITNVKKLSTQEIDEFLEKADSESEIDNE